jgi:hypothetical protein
LGKEEEKEEMNLQSDETLGNIQVIVKKEFLNIIEHSKSINRQFLPTWNSEFLLLDN